MPTYQYRCKNCDELIEAVQKFTDPALTECPACGGTLAKVYNAVGVVFKGSGFYKTDSRPTSSGGSGSSGSGGAKPDTASSGGTAAPSTPSSGSSTASTTKD